MASEDRREDRSTDGSGPSGPERASSNEHLTYRAAGVDIDAGDALVEAIKPLARATRRTGVMGGLGGFGALFDLRAAGFHDPILVSTTDGVGTKLRVAIETGLHDTVGIDLVAMCVNDLVVQGADPLFFLDYFATGRLEVAQAAAIIAGIAEGCRQAGCALVGGETAEMPGMYGGGDYDLAGFAVGAAERDSLLPRDVRPGDALLGLASSGVHSNGFSLVRRIVAASGLAWTAPAPFAASPGSSAPGLSVPGSSGLANSASGGSARDNPAPGNPAPGNPVPGNPDSAALPQTLGRALMTPTRIYVRSLLALNKAGLLKAAAHITGGGLPGNVPRVLPEGVVAALEPGWTVPPVFRWLACAGGVAADEMARVFNCGLGMVLVVAAAEVDAAVALLTAEGETVYRIGTIQPGEGEARISFTPPADWLA